ncbi:hypothetical protein HNP46_004201 [Pseudomonas nitritireducens]|uniref:Uncharacterized protein n=1 Tax=Pseudomonas nitroreducens TaxID=46680 RepID=A0A7W7KMW9_PSENT|nr:hypothetical protein [Pseudomonas nitritireducens]MBB4865320.1 hypothetical protein [Pseudomonas nitritireducens]
MAVPGSSTTTFTINDIEFKRYAAQDAHGCSCESLYADGRYLGDSHSGKHASFRREIILAVGDFSHWGRSLLNSRAVQWGGKVYSKPNVPGEYSVKINDQVFQVVEKGPRANTFMIDGAPVPGRVFFDTFDEKVGQTPAGYWIYTALRDEAVFEAVLAEGKASKAPKSAGDDVGLGL